VESIEQFKFKKLKLLRKHLWSKYCIQMWYRYLQLICNFLQTFFSLCCL